MTWSTADIPSQAGKLAVVTGATGGLGFETALALARAGADVVLAGRSPEKGAAAVNRILEAHSGATVSFEGLDLARLASVAAFAERLAARDRPLDILVNNAGIMALPQRATTGDGYEVQFQTNHLGHFALTARLLPQLQAAPAARVVSLSSIAALSGTIALDDLQSERYRPWRAYGQSKLACLMFALELHRRSTAGNWGLASMAAHPGLSSTELIANGPGSGGPVHALIAGVLRVTLPMMGQSAALGALPQLYAAAAPQTVSGGYYGPDGFRELRGAPTDAQIPPAALDRTVAGRLWDASEQLTGVAFPALSKAA